MGLEASSWQTNDNVAVDCRITVSIGVGGGCDMQPWARAAHLYYSAEADSAFHPAWNGESVSAYGLSNNNNGDGGCGW